jgi:hypothetical protein
VDLPRDGGLPCLSGVPVAPRRLLAGIRKAGRFVEDRGQRGRAVLIVVQTILDRPDDTLRFIPAASSARRLKGAQTSSPDGWSGAPRPLTCLTLKEE